MKKYTIKDDKGNKKIIYADSLSQAIKLQDAFNLKPGDVYLKKNNETTVYKVLKIDNTDKGFNSIFNSINVTTEAYTYNVFSGKIERESGASNQSLDRNDIKTVFFSMNEAIKYLQRKAKQYELFSKSLRKDSTIKDVRLEKGDWFTLRNNHEDIFKVIDDQQKEINGFSKAMIVERYQIKRESYIKPKELKIVKVGNESFHPERWSTFIVRFNSAKEAVEWLKRQLDLMKQHKFDSKTNDEASLAATINALINDEKAAIDSYNVAIKNLEGSIDDTAKQVLINIRDDERRHIENLYAILNGQVTEKNLEDSIHDAVNDSKMKDKSIHHEWLIEHAKRLYEYAKIDNFGSVKREAENLIDGIDNNNLG